METVVGIFKTREECLRAIENLRAAGIPDDRVTLLMPGASENEFRNVATTETEQSGDIGGAIGGVVGGSIGAAGGLTLGTTIASFFIPGVGPVIAAGLLGAAVLGAGGALGGVAIGEALDSGLVKGLPKDELFFYEDALRQGRSVLIVAAGDGRQPDAVRRLLTMAGAEGVDSAREDWWLGLRDAEREHYTAEGRDFGTDESTYRKGFEAALTTEARGRTYEEAVNLLMAQYPEVYSEDAFRKGYERGRNHERGLLKRFEKTA